jgi:hypothetical protein
MGPIFKLNIGEDRTEKMEEEVGLRGTRDEEGRKQ